MDRLVLIVVGFDRLWWSSLVLIDCVEIFLTTTAQVGARVDARSVEELPLGKKQIDEIEISLSTFKYFASSCCLWFLVLSRLRGFLICTRGANAKGAQEARSERQSHSLSSSA